MDKLSNIYINKEWRWYYLNVIISKFKEGVLAVLPITVIVLILNFTIVPIETDLILRFVVGSIIIMIGLSIFLLGADLSIVPMGSHMGAAITKSKKIWIVMVFGFILGFLITVAEPALQILANQVDVVTAGKISSLSILLVVSGGVGLLLVVGLMRVVYNVSLPKLLTILYGGILILSIFCSKEFLAVAFDASGATTGAVAVPFIMSIGLGVSAMKAGKISEDDSFGMVGMASVGPIVAVLIMGIISKTESLTGSLAYNSSGNGKILSPFMKELPAMASDVMWALIPLVILFFIFQIFILKLSRKKLTKILKGILYTFIGLVLFLTGVNAGFMEAGVAMGFAVASLDYNWILIVIGFVLGLAVILAEPAVYLLNEQVEEVTSGHIKKRTMLLALSIGVAAAVALSMLRIMIPGIQLWHYLLPGYIISIIMSRYVPKIFVGIAFDSGGVASGPMNGTFILAFAQGAAEAIEGANVLIDGFGIIALVALTPLIAVQVLGLVYKHKAKKGNMPIESSDIELHRVSS